MPEYITTHEASELSGYNVEYIRQMIRADKIEAIKRGRDWWIDRDSFISYVRQSKEAKDKRHGPRK